jgi:tetratricopeptide (TPR) repeat protein
VRQPAREVDRLFERAARLHNNGRLEEAVALYVRILGFDDGIAGVHSNLAVALQSLGNFRDAAKHYERALELEPDSTLALDNYGTLLQKRGEHAAAVPYHERAIALDPNLPRAHHNLGNAFLILRRPDAAIVPLRRALDLQPRFAEALNCLGAAYQALGSLNDAIACYREAITVAPRFADAHANMGNALRDNGDISGAVKAFETAVALQPRAGRFHRLLIEACGNRASHEQIEFLETLLADGEALSVDDLIQTHFGLGKAYDTENDVERAFTHLRDGNALARSICVYDEAVTIEEFKLWTRLFSKPLIGNFTGYGNPSSAPVFIFGMPRSGTTLVEQILAAHPQVVAAGELGAIQEIIRKFTAIESDPNDVAAFRAAFIDRLSTLGAQYVDIVEKISSSALRVTDKWPWSFKFVGLIHMILPNARLIHVRRKPAETCLSCFSTLFVDNLPYMYDLGEIGRYYRAYEETMRFWLDALPDGRVFEIQYEELVEDFETQARRLIAYCGLDWDEACREFWTARRPVRTASAVAVRQPLYKGALDRARLYGARLEPLTAALEGV